MRAKAYLTTSVLMTLLFSVPIEASTVPVDSLPGQFQTFGDITSNSNIRIAVAGTTVPQDCKTTGDEHFGSSLCKQPLSGGGVATRESHYERAWNEFKNQTTITELNAKGQRFQKRIVRRKTEYSNDQHQIRTRDSFDIVSYPPGQKITREVLIFEYYKDGKTISKISYAKYSQIDDLAFASLDYNLWLRYDEEGFPLRGQVERWNGASKLNDLFSWNRSQQGVENFDPAAWQQWEMIAKRASLQEALFVF